MNIPEDSVLRRHYLTEMKSQMDKRFDNFLERTQKSEVEIVHQPIWSNGVMLPVIAFCFFMAVIFI